MDIWIYEYMDMWIFGYMDRWIYGHMETWIYGYVSIPPSRRSLQWLGMPPGLHLTTEGKTERRGTERMGKG